MNAPPMPDWSPSDGPWCLNEWITAASPHHDQSVVCCLLAPLHDGDCRDQYGIFRNLSSGDIPLGITRDGLDAKSRKPIGGSGD